MMYPKPVYKKKENSINRQSCSLKTAPAICAQDLTETTEGSLCRSITYSEAQTEYTLRHTASRCICA